MNFTQLVVGIMLCLFSVTLQAAPKKMSDAANIQHQLAQLEAKANGRLGVSALDTANGHSINYRSQERFPVCSTSKVIAVGAILKRSQANPELLNKKIVYTAADVEPSYSPITKQHIKTGMTIKELSRAAMLSDNSAMNLLIKELGGLSAVNHFARTLGNTSFHLDRLEPVLSNVAPGEVHDTATPKDMMQSLNRLVLVNHLAPGSRQQLKTWLVANTTGEHRIRAGLPKSWQVGDKTGTGNYGTTNDIAVIWPPHCKPIVLATYFTQPNKQAKPKDFVLAMAAHNILQALAKNNSCLRQALHTV